MTAHGFTAGPWHADVTVGNCGGWTPAKQRVSVWAKVGLVCTYETSYAEYPDDAENEANARLIAAAPRYHAAAEEMLRVAEVGVVNDLEAFGRAIRLLREAHAAATGSRG